jgi:hypothetical protein
MPARRIAAALGLAALVLTLLPAAQASAATTDNFWIFCPYQGISGSYDLVNGSTSYVNDYFANTTTTAASTPASLQAAGTGATACTTSTDTAAYFSRTIVLGPGEVQNYGPAGYPCFTDPAGLTACHFSNIRAYYGLGSVARAAITNIPFGELATGGNPDATGVQSINVVDWSCGDSTPFETHPYDCTPYISLGQSDQDGVIERIILPRCWDGTGTAPGDFAYPVTGQGGNCPTGFPKVLPLINVRFHTGIKTPCPGLSCPAGNTMTPAFGWENPDGSMDPWYKAYGGFANGWQYGDHGTTGKLGGLDDLTHDCLIVAGSCPTNPHTSASSNMPT